MIKSKEAEVIDAYIDENASSVILLRGKNLVRRNFVELVKNNTETHQALFKVNSEGYKVVYKVKVNNYNDLEKIESDCNCPYTWGAICKHRVAAMLLLREIFEGKHEEFNKLIGKKQPDVYHEPLESQVNLSDIDIDKLKVIAGRDVARDGIALATGKINILKAQEGEVIAEVKDKKYDYQVSIRKNEKNNFVTSCNCWKNSHIVCEHRYALFLYLAKNEGRNYFATIINYNPLKEALLAEYGYALSDPYEDKFEFKISSNGNIELVVKDPSLRKIIKYQQLDEISSTLNLDHADATPLKNIQDAHSENQVFFVFDFSKKKFPFFQITTITAKVNASGLSAVQVMGSQKQSAYLELDENKQQVQYQLNAITGSQVASYLYAKTGKSYFYWKNDDVLDYFNFSESEQTIMSNYIFSKLDKLLEALEKESHAYVHFKGAITAKSIYEVKASSAMLRLIFTMREDEEFIELLMQGMADERILPAGSMRLYANMFVLCEDVIYRLNTLKDRTIINYMGDTGIIRVKKEDSYNFITTLVIPLQKHYEVNLPEHLLLHVADVEFKKVLQIKEFNEKYLLITPSFRYNGQLVDTTEASDILIEKDGKFANITRNQLAEQAFFDQIKNSHPVFASQGGQGFLHISFNDALKENWFFRLYENLQAEDVEIIGFDDLQKFKYNPHKAKISLKVGTGIDWFDVNIEVSFGDQLVMMKDLRRAVINKQNFVQLGDGTLGLLPEEWVKKHYMLFRIGSEDKKDIKISKLHFSVIDELYDQIDDEKVRFELDEKREKLRNFSSIKSIPVPANIKAVLRPYQEHGFFWFNFLDEFGWGGCLADDMGLGKTLQTLTWLQHLKIKAKKSKGVKLTHIIVCPNSLLFNWENEINKFCPDLTYFVHHGNTRSRQFSDFVKYDIIITSYGTLRSDILAFSEIPFYCVILDESQAIKNPASKIAKAVLLLNCKTRLILSGTPVQNNTFDLYSQMNFLNPGLLGNIEFFKSEFANPIDKLNDAEKMDQLKRLIYPFILRRTKEQVAKDLPEKTEMILYCEMGAEQRRIYESFRYEYREQIMKRIEEEGLSKSGIFVLQGLMKLRQICDSPSILNESENYPAESVKLDELVRELLENVGEHKALVFSQFLGMLALIREKLEEAGINYSYLDGKTKDRRGVVEKFQDDPNCKVFLLSLTVGGVGLNLTSADYVYIVDPWWNPAVEQQAIDRTHRIGQMNNIFAYKMICKDSIEEKILKLQEKKKGLAKEVISDDSAFVKKLTKEDIEYLFD